MPRNNKVTPEIEPEFPFCKPPVFFFFFFTPIWKFLSSWHDLGIQGNEKNCWRISSHIWWERAIYFWHSGGRGRSGAYLGSKNRSDRFYPMFINYYCSIMDLAGGFACAISSAWTTSFHPPIRPFEGWQTETRAGRLFRAVTAGLSGGTRIPAGQSRRTLVFDRRDTGWTRVQVESARSQGDVKMISIAPNFNKKYFLFKDPFPNYVVFKRF